MPEIALLFRNNLVNSSGLRLPHNVDRLAAFVNFVAQKGALRGVVLDANIGEEVRAGVSTGGEVFGLRAVGQLDGVGLAGDVVQLVLERSISA